MQRSVPLSPAQRTLKKLTNRLNKNKRHSNDRNHLFIHFTNLALDVELPQGQTNPHVLEIMRDARFHGAYVPLERLPECIAISEVISPAYKQNETTTEDDQDDEFVNEHSEESENTQFVELLRTNLIYDVTSSIDKDAVPVISKHFSEDGKQTAAWKPMMNATGHFTGLFKDANDKEYIVSYVGPHMASEELYDSLYNISDLGKSKTFGQVATDGTYTTMLRLAYLTASRLNMETAVLTGRAIKHCEDTTAFHTSERLRNPLIAEPSYVQWVNTFQAGSLGNTVRFFNYCSPVHEQDKAFIHICNPLKHIELYSRLGTVVSSASQNFSKPVGVFSTFGEHPETFKRAISAAPSKTKSATTAIQHGITKHIAALARTEHAIHDNEWKMTRLEPVAVVVCEE